MKIALLALVAVGATSYAEPYRMSKSDDGCGGLAFLDLTPENVPLQVEVPTTGHARDVGDKDEGPGAAWSASDPDEKTLYELRVQTPQKRDLDFKSVKAFIEANAKKNKAKITWTKSEKTSDGYAFVYADLLDGTTSYEVLYLRTIDKQPWLCSNSSSNKASLSCAVKSCAELKAK